tara:strand:+ start:50509 stop:50652 length:144 start_codon:yes stop_codon:yes gene_type:complete
MGKNGIWFVELIESVFANNIEPQAVSVPKVKVEEKATPAKKDKKKKK